MSTATTCPAMASAVPDGAAIVTLSFSSDCGLWRVERVGDLITMFGATHVDERSIDQLSDWIAFYDGMSIRYDHAGYPVQAALLRMVM